ncbi:MAG: ABC transporter ATP-binding protein [Planctomycetota bacterium]
MSVQAQVINRGPCRRSSSSYIFITHDLSVVRYISDRVAVMYLGRIVEMGTAEQIFDDARHPYTKALLSAIPRANPAHRTERIRLQGDVPSPIKPPSGCHFHPRCSAATEACKVSYPEPQGDPGGRFLRCHEASL